MSHKRPPAKLAALRGMRGETECKTGVYKRVSEDSSTVSTKQYTTAAGFGTKPNERLHALRILSTLFIEKSSLSKLMPPAQEVSPMTKEICFGFCRHYFRLQAIAKRLLQKKPKEVEIWIILLIGFYQLHYMRQPDYAVVKETVTLLEKIKKTWAKALVNAVLRTFCRQRQEILADLGQDPLFLYGQPQWLLEILQKDWPNDWQMIAQANDIHPPMTLRVNQRKNSRADYLDTLTQANIAATVHPLATHGLNLSTPCEVQQLPGFTTGHVSVQDAAAQLAVSLLCLKPGLRLLDACCAPGGKTCHILETEPNLAACIALDIAPKRLQRVQENLNRLNLQATLVSGDAANPGSWWDGQCFDRILLDAPCSATGVIRRHPDIKLLRTYEEIQTISKIQQQMLQALWPLLAKGGLLVYATCSVLCLENEQQMAQFSATKTDCKIITEKKFWGRPTGHGQQVIPGEQDMDGFFYAVLSKQL